MAWRKARETPPRSPLPQKNGDPEAGGQGQAREISRPRRQVGSLPGGSGVKAGSCCLSGRPAQGALCPLPPSGPAKELLPPPPGSRGWGRARACRGSRRRPPPSGGAAEPVRGRLPRGPRWTRGGSGCATRVWGPARGGGHSWCRSPGGRRGVLRGAGLPGRQPRRVGQPRVRRGGQRSPAALLSRPVKRAQLPANQRLRPSERPRTAGEDPPPPVPSLLLRPQQACAPPRGPRSLEGRRGRGLGVRPRCRARGWGAQQVPPPSIGADECWLEPRRRRRRHDGLAAAARG
ncbi:proline-rich protein 2-like [Sphaerodactylus townsendi]|uniref:proline-rich protein 2-like n=1 Tax=Sphaerodactylus townsendi TaxID=933632 RepID=UPI00202602AA|nr:proline-rich protein 2-like [Sphaerodactylus townsendi]